jgi:YD repeat-containing protein
MMRPLHVAVQLAFVAASALPLVTEAATCTVGAGVRTIGNEFFASAAYPDGSYEYQVTILLCSGGVPSYFNGTSFTGTPAAVIQAYRSLNSTRVFRNQCGSMGLIAHDRFLGTIDDGVVAVDLGLSAHPLNATYIDEFVKGIAPGEGFPIPCGCTGGLARLPGSVACTPPPAVKAPDLCVGNPIVPGQGCKVQWETDYTFGGASPLNFKRYYHSQSPYHDRSAAQRSAGQPLATQPRRPAQSRGSANLVLLLRDDGQILYFRPKAGSATDWVSDADIVGQLKKTATGWTWRESDDAVETFDAAGRRLARVERGGLSLSYSYVPGSDRLAGIQDNFGRSLTLTYNAQNLLSELTTPLARELPTPTTATATSPPSPSRRSRAQLQLHQRHRRKVTSSPRCSPASLTKTPTLTPPGPTTPAPSPQAASTPGASTPYLHLPERRCRQDYRQQRHQSPGRRHPIHLSEPPRRQPRVDHQPAAHARPQPQLHLRRQRQRRQPHRLQRSAHDLHLRPHSQPRDPDASKPPASRSPHHQQRMARQLPLALAHCRTPQAHPLHLRRPPATSQPQRTGHHRRQWQPWLRRPRVGSPRTWTFTYNALARSSAPTARAPTSPT